MFSSFASKILQHFLLFKKLFSSNLYKSYQARILYKTAEITEMNVVVFY
jgi:hypothetical protein